MKKIAIIGECMIELSGLPFAAMQQSYGGDTLNTATYLARISTHAQVYYLSAMGTDNLSQEMIKRWRQDGIDTTYVLTDSERQPGLYLIQLSDKGERTFLYWRNASAARYLLQHPNWKAIEQALPAFNIIYLSGISLAVLPAEDRNRLINMLITYSKNGGILAFDGNYRPALWQSEEETRICYSALLPHIQLALMTFEDELALWGDINPEASISRLQTIGVSEIVIKLGAEGTLYAHGAIREKIAATPVANVIDTTAAGDAFNAGFLHGYLQNVSSHECCDIGNRLAAIVIQHKGAIIAKAYCQI